MVVGFFALFINLGSKTKNKRLVDVPPCLVLYLKEIISPLSTLAHASHLSTAIPISLQASKKSYLPYSVAPSMSNLDL